MGDLLLKSLIGKYYLLRLLLILIDLKSTILFIHKTFFYKASELRELSRHTRQQQHNFVE